jgi:hypothetical protein
MVLDDVLNPQVISSITTRATVTTIPAIRPTDSDSPKTASPIRKVIAASRPRPTA